MIRKSLAHRLRRLAPPRAVGVAALLRMVGMVLGVMAGILMARLGGAHVKGVASAYAAACAIGFLVVNVDLAQQALREGRHRSNLGYARASLRLAWAAYAVLGLALGALLFASAPSALWMVGGIGAYLLGTQAAILAAGLAGAATAAATSVAQQMFMVIAVLCLGVADALNADTVRLALIASYLAPLPILLRVARSVPLEPIRKSELWPILRRGVPWQSVRLLQTLLARVDTLFVFAWHGAAAAGIYSVGLSLAELINLIPNQFATDVIFKSANRVKFSLAGTMRRAGIAGSATGALVAICGYPAIVILYGSAFSGGYLIMLLTLPGVVCFGLTQIMIERCRALGLLRMALVPSLTGATLMGIGLGTLGPLGSPGVAVASSIGGLASFAVVLAFLRKVPDDA